MSGRRTGDVNTRICSAIRDLVCGGSGSGVISGVVGGKKNIGG